ncbi:spinster family MFS transporter [Sphingobium subterraneum]|uniref:MFS family permease n=1 Tax=Sphingobium subterraneum TaxID=627688 RepID=A0A841J3Q7_9SPHN|nr:MFS transporter [Sphingobium subterraneum]MBB6125330.1 MFS family permease [Sphingobium subterraneum]
MANRSIPSVTDAIPEGRAPAALEEMEYKPVRAWISIAILLIFSLFSFLDRQLIALMVDPIKADLGLNDTELGLLQGMAFALCYAVAGLPIGWAVDRYPRRIILFAGLAIWSASAAACGLARSFWQLFFFRTLVGAGEATLSPAAVSLISDLFPRDKIGAPLGVYSAGYYIGSGAALAIGGWLVVTFTAMGSISLPYLGVIAPWQATFMAAGAPGILVAFLAFAMYDPKDYRKISRQPETQSVIALLRISMRGRWTATNFGFLAFGAATLANYAVAAWTPAYMMRVFGWQASDVGWIFGLVVVCSGASGALLGGMLLDRLFRAGRKDACYLLGAVVTALALPCLVTAYFVSSPTVLIVLLCMALSLLGMVTPCCWSTWQWVAPPSTRGQVTALFVLISALMGTGLGPVLVGAITDHVFGNELMVGYSIAAVAAITLPVMILAFLLGRPSLRAVVTMSLE